MAILPVNQPQLTAFDQLIDVHENDDDTAVDYVRY